jgi:hypothetical protein
MKSNILIYQLDKQYVSGTNSENEMRNYFGSKMLEIEDSIIIDDISIQYTELVSNDNNNGFQSYTYDNLTETIKIKNLSDLKLENSSIELQSQNTVDLENNTKWLIRINCKKILQEYLFLKIKENRTFKCISYEDLYGYDINTYIRRYINKNILNRYKFNKIDLYINYINIITEGNIYNTVKLKYNPVYNRNIINNDNLVKNVNIQQISNILYLDELKVLYNQIKKSTEYKIEYYFNIHFSKV